MVRKYSGFSKLAMTCFHLFEIKSDWCHVTDLIKQVFNAGGPFKEYRKASLFLLKHTVLSVSPVDTIQSNSYICCQGAEQKKILKHENVLKMMAELHFLTHLNV